MKPMDLGYPTGLSTTYIKRGQIVLWKLCSNWWKFALISFKIYILYIIFLSGIEDSSHPGNYFKSLKAFVSMAVKQAAGGVPSGNHGLFHRYD